jgi:hypothetical protein
MPSCRESAQRITSCCDSTKHISSSWESAALSGGKALGGYPVAGRRTKCWAAVAPPRTSERWGSMALPDQRSADMNERGSPWPTSSCWESSLHMSSAAKAPCRYHASGKECADTKLLGKGSEDLKMLTKAGHISTYRKCAMGISFSWQRLGRFQEAANSPPRSHNVSGQGWADIKLLGKHRGKITLLGSTGQI